MPKITLPLWNECEEAKDKGEATALQLFIYNHEPSGCLDEDWRAQLRAVLEEATANAR